MEVYAVGRLRHDGRMRARVIALLCVGAGVLCSCSKDPGENGISAEVHIDAEGLNVAASVNQLLEYLHSSGVLKAGYLPVSISA